jgi:predicted nucleic acid-binding protein
LEAHLHAMNLIEEGKIFIDTNIFIYSVDNRDQTKKTFAQELIDKAFKSQRLTISFQVVQEFINTAIRLGLSKPFNLNSFCLNVLFPVWEIYPTRDLYLKAIEIQERYQYSFYDSMIIAAALEGNCKTLYSEDLQHDQKIESLTIIDPFKT